MMSHAIKQIRTEALLSQMSFAKELGVSIATIQRWESGKARPNITAMNKLKTFCIKNEVMFNIVEREWKNGQ